MSLDDACRRVDYGTGRSSHYPRTAIETRRSAPLGMIPLANQSMMMAERGNSRQQPLPGCAGPRALAGRSLPGSILPTRANVPIAVGATGTTMPGVRRLYKTLRGKAVAHGL